MFNKATKTALLSAAVLSGAMVAQAASASMITQWDYTILSGFSNYTSTAGDSSGITASGSGFAGDPTKLSWVGANGTTTSSVSIDGSVNGTDLRTNSPGVAGATFTHDNQVLNNPTISLRSFQLGTNLALTANAPADEVGQKPNPAIPTIAFSSFFSETNNQTPCAVNDGGTPCSDIFVLSNSTGGQTMGDDGAFVLSQDFSTDDGGLYTALLSINGLGILGDSACTAAGASTGCIGLTTFEDNTNQFTTNLQIVSRAAVPEPGSLLMLLAGLGLVGFGFAARRRNSQQG